MTKYICIYNTNLYIPADKGGFETKRFAINNELEVDLSKLDLDSAMSLFTAEQNGAINEVGVEYPYFPVKENRVNAIKELDYDGRRQYVIAKWSKVFETLNDARMESMVKSNQEFLDKKEAKK